MEEQRNRKRRKKGNMRRSRIIRKRVYIPYLPGFLYPVYTFFEEGVGERIYLEVEGVEEELEEKDILTQISLHRPVLIPANPNTSSYKQRLFLAPAVPSTKTITTARAGTSHPRSSSTLHAGRSLYQVHEHFLGSGTQNQFPEPKTSSRGWFPVPGTRG